MSAPCRSGFSAGNSRARRVSTMPRTRSSNALKPTPGEGAPSHSGARRNATPSRDATAFQTNIGEGQVSGRLSQHAEGTGWHNCPAIGLDPAGTALMFFRAALRLRGLAIHDGTIRRCRRAAWDDEVIDQHQDTEKDEAPCPAAKDTDADRDRHEGNDPQNSISTHMFRNLLSF